MIPNNSQINCAYFLFGAFIRLFKLSKRHVKTFSMRKVVFTLNIPDIDKVKLDVNVTTKNSLASRKKAINAPSTIQIHFKVF